MPATANISRHLVTGADGFVGRHLMGRLRRSFPHATIIAGCRKVEVDLPEADFVVRFELDDVDEFPSTLSAVNPDFVFHLAAEASVGTSFTSPILTWRRNVLGTVALADAVVTCCPGTRLIFASSGDVYGLSFNSGHALNEDAPLLPTSPYASAKAAAELALAEMALRGLDVIRLRLFSHTGPGQSDRFVVPAFCKTLVRIWKGVSEPVIKTGALNRKRDFLDVQDVCSAYVACLSQSLPSGSVFNIASGRSRMIGEILGTLINLLSLKVEIREDPSLLRPNDILAANADIHAAETRLSWVPLIPWDKTLESVLGFWVEQIEKENRTR